ncbi:acetylornithine deacetylase [Caldalkalibacillus salinus]|uniref:acetylornithine deacetylase n=1 Tax=Caldalkalibacillus salinus TaxID=2803787 RepID=UPI0030190A17
MSIQIKQQTLDHLMQQVDTRKDELIELLKTLITFETPSPPARNTSEAQRFIAQYLRDMDFETDMWEVYPGDPNVVGVKKGIHSQTYHSLIINGHIDVAEVDDEGWTSSPFEPLVKDGRIYGRGSADMKGGMAGVLFALKLLEQNGIQLPGDVILQSVIGEEVGEAGTLECCRKGYGADFAIVVDTSDLNIHGQGGVITGWITIKSPTTFHDGTRRHMIHAGGGLFGASAIEKMAKIIQGLQELERHWAVTKSYPGFPHGTNTINPAVIEGGRHPAFIADECKLWVTVHFYPDESHQQVAQEVEDYIRQVAAADPWLREHPPTFEWGGTSMIEDKGEIFPSLDIDIEHPGVQSLMSAHQSVVGEAPKVGMSTSVTDGGWLGEAGIPTVIYGPGEMREAHSVNESLSIAQLIHFTKVMVQTIYTWSHQKKT